MTTNEELREISLIYIGHFIGTWYSWGSEGPGGFDCSGLGSEYLLSAGKIRRGERFSANGIWERFANSRVPKPYRGCMVLYHNGIDVERAIHVEICLSEYQSLGASGGGSNTITKEDAIRDNAFVKVRPINSRGNILGYIDPFLEAI